MMRFTSVIDLHNNVCSDSFLSMTGPGSTSGHDYHMRRLLRSISASLGPTICGEGRKFPFLMAFFDTSFLSRRLCLRGENIQPCISNNSDAFMEDAITRRMIQVYLDISLPWRQPGLRPNPLDLVPHMTVRGCPEAQIYGNITSSLNLDDVEVGPANLCEDSSITLFEKRRTLINQESKAEQLAKAQIPETSINDKVSKRLGQSKTSVESGKRTRIVGSSVARDHI